MSKEMRILVVDDFPTMRRIVRTLLKELGYKVNLQSLNSGLHAISIEENGLFGGADPRREGIALGQ